MSYAALEKAYTQKCTARCGEPVTIKWNNRYKNWRIFWKGKMRAELLTGEKLNVDKVAKIIRNIQGDGIEKKFKAYSAAREYRKRKEEESKEERAQYYADEMRKYGDTPIVIINNETGEKDIIYPKNKKHFTIKGK